jgi:regulatory protein
MKRNNIITKIERQEKRKRYNIYVDYQYKFSVDEDILIKYRLLKEREILPQEIEEIIISDEFNKMYNRAIRYIGFKSRTEKEVYDYLKNKEYPNELILRVLESLKEANFLNDAFYAENYVKERILLNPKGKKLLAYELKLKGVTPTIIENSLRQLDNQLELDLAYQLLIKRRKTIASADWNTIHNRLAGYLQRRGFSYGITVQALELLKADNLDNNSK